MDRWPEGEDDEPTSVSALSQNTPFLDENRLRWIRRTGGRRERVRLLVAVRAFLHLGQFLIGAGRKSQHGWDATDNAGLGDADDLPSVALLHRLLLNKGVQAVFKRNLVLEPTGRNR